MKKVCTNCHFFGKGHSEKSADEGVNLFVSNDEREMASSGKKEFTKPYYSVRCLMGVWDERFNEKGEDLNHLVAIINRNDKCFFFPYDEGMMLEAAKELQKRKQEYSQLRRSNMYTRIGLFIAAFALVANVAINLFKP